MTATDATADASPADLPWQDPVASYADRADDEPVVDLVRAAAQVGPSILVLGAGFDPRCTSGLEAVIHAVPDIAVLVLDLAESSGARPSSAMVARRDANVARITELTNGAAHTLPFPTVHDTASVGRILAHGVTSATQDPKFGHIVVDISAMPTRVSFPVLKGLLSSCAEGPGSPELQVLVSENPELDGSIVRAGVDEAQLVAGFMRPLNSAKPPGQTRAWIPVLGRGSEQALRKVHEFIDPDVIHPVLPFPARDPRRPDALLLEHRALLVDAFEIRASDYLYADERNPFDLFRSLVRFAREYRRTFEPVGEAVVAISCHASKLLAMGALLAAYTERLPVVSAVASHYELDEASYEEASRDKDRLSCLWLRGTPYRIANAAG